MVINQFLLIISYKLTRLIVTFTCNFASIFDDMSAERYDFVVVGGGTAGLVLANRLTENSEVTVLVLESGHDLTSDPRVTTPALFPTLLGSEADWNTVTEPQVRHLLRSNF